ncbi:hypothetical protein XI25_02070 [Paenibacillus sp. DMB20]|nr:hypothetical protein XI25_02070 [Paenibacillus sp. DMB20]
MAKMMNWSKCKGRTRADERAIQLKMHAFESARVSPGIFRLSLIPEKQPTVMNAVGCFVFYFREMKMADAYK